MSRVTWDEQDCSEMPLLASEKIAQLRAENKELIGKIPTPGMAIPDSEIIVNWNDEMGILRNENKALKESRDELLEALNKCWDDITALRFEVEKVIKQHEAPKEKETK